MSIKYKIPVVMLIAFVLNIVILFVYYKVYLYNRVEQYQAHMDEMVSEETDKIAVAIHNVEVDDALVYLNAYDNGKNFIINLQNTTNGEITVWNAETSHRFGFSQVRLITLSGRPYILQVQKKIELVNLRANSLFSDILYFECIVQFVLFLAVGSVIHFRYVKTLLKLDKKMKLYKNGDILRFAVRGKDEIAQLQASFRDLTQKLYEEKQTQNRMIASISHDIKTPLTSVLGYSERIATKKLSPERLEKYTQIIYKQAMDIEAIIDEFDDYLTTTIPVTTQLQCYNVSYLCAMLKDEYSLQLREQEIEFYVVNGCDEEIAVMVDLLKLRRIFANIISNSVRHAGVSHLRIEITAGIENSNVVFTIADNGHGVSDEDLKHIFEPFYTSDKSRRVSGLGLSICKQMMDGIGGEIVAHNNILGGLSIVLMIPLFEQVNNRRT